MRRMGIGLQLYTVREELALDFRGTLRRVAELGFEGVEFAGYGGLEAEELKELLKELNLKAIGAHIGLNNMREHLDEEIKYLKTIEAPYLICPFLKPEDRADAEAWTSLFRFFKEAGTRIKEAGLQFAYHNHAFEFEAKMDEAFVFDALYASTPPEAVQVEMDVCWVQYAGQDPIHYINRYAGRLPLLHLKDFQPEPTEPMNTVELGRGVVDLPKVIEASSAAGVEWLIVEQDRCENPPLESVSSSLRWVKEHYLSRFSI